jgi:hypothetical protein
LPTQPEPYVGARPFFEADAAQFYGREREVNTLRALVIAHPVTLVYGPSGAGKSSLIHAGLVPQLAGDGFEVLPAVRLTDPGAGRGVAAEPANPYIFRTLSGLAGRRGGGDVDLAALASMSLAHFLSWPERPDARSGSPVGRVVIFDQLEELFGEVEYWEARRGFFEQVQEALDTERGLRAVFVIREDYLGALEPYGDYLEERLRIRLRVEPLRRGAAVAAVVKPLEATGIRFAPDVAERLVGDLLKVPIKSSKGAVIVDNEFVEPLQLQLAARGLWHALREDESVVTEVHLAKAGDPEQALFRFYEQVVAEVSREGVEERLLRLWFERELITPEGSRRLVYGSEGIAAGLPARAVDRLVASYLIRTELRGGSVFYELAHDRFIQPIRESNRVWLLRQPSAQRPGSLLEDGAARWESKGRPSNLLLDAADLNAAKRWLNSPEAQSFRNSPTLSKYLFASHDAQQQKRTGLIRLFVIVLLLQFLLNLLLVLLLVRTR